jgi:hypothetical protein
MCQTDIDALKQCHANNTKLKFWACNDFKFAMDRCFKLEKEHLLKEMNVNYEEKRKREDDALQDAMGHSQSFDEYLKQDKDYLREMEKAKGRKPGSFTERASST